LIGEGNQPKRAIASKDFKVFFRDIAQASQSLMLLGICSFYVFGIRILHAFNVSIPGWGEQTWGQFLVLVSAATEAFIVSAVCTRFVYPSVSLEGESFWIVQTSPVTMREVVRAKFLTWLVPVSLLCITVFCVGASGIGLGWASLTLKALSTFMVCYGMVGLAIGLGAVFANFNWEHSAQLAAGFGNLVFMLAGVVLVSVSLLLLWVPLYLDYRGLADRWPSAWLFGTISSYVLLAALNYGVSQWALSFGERSLVRRGD
jgi:ABC-2 type transport system permease protein